MYTRCQACHTVHPINAELLSRAAGQYRCGKCKKLSNALDALFDEWPSAGETVVNSRPDTQAPVLGGSLALEIEGVVQHAQVEHLQFGQDIPVPHPQAQPLHRVGRIHGGLAREIERAQRQGGHVRLGVTFQPQSRPGPEPFSGKRSTFPDRNRKRYHIVLKIELRFSEGIFLEDKAQIAC